MRPVNEKALIPVQSSGTIVGINLWISDIVQQLSRIFTEYGFRINRVYPKDGTENMESVRIDDAVSSVPGAVSATAFIYVDAADGDLKVKFSNGDIQVLATVSV